jgi:hypothetical protein
MVSIDNNDNQSIAIPFDIEDNAIISNEACRSEDSLNITRRTPICLPHVSIPRPQWFFGVWMRFPELAQCSTSKDSHGSLPLSA